MEVCDDNRLICDVNRFIWVEAGRNTGMYMYIDPQVFVLIMTVWQVHTCIHNTRTSNLHESHGAVHILDFGIYSCKEKLGTG